MHLLVERRLGEGVRAQTADDRRHALSELNRISVTSHDYHLAAAISARHLGPPFHGHHLLS